MDTMVRGRRRPGYRRGGSGSRARGRLQRPTGSLFLARRRLIETHTLVGLEGSCPHCGEAVTLEAPARLRSPHPVACEECHHEATLHVEGSLGD